jgi:mannosyltransferase
MTPHGPRALLTRAPSVPAEPPPRSGQDFDGGPLWMRLAPPLVTLVVMLWGLTGSSYWRDESATLAAVQRPFGQLLRMLGHVDAVHGAYYVIMWPLAKVAGTSEVVMRLPSAIAMVAAAALVAALARRLVSPAAGLASGLVFAVIPAVSLYAEDARSYAMVTALAAGASYLLVRLIYATEGRRGWTVGYGLCLAALAWLNFFALLLLAAHAVTVALLCLRRASQGADRRAWLPLAVSWLAAAAGAVAVTSPIILLAWTERTQLAWLSTPSASSLGGLAQLIGSGLMPLMAALIVAGGVLASALAGPATLRRRWPPMLVVLAVTWLVVPPALLVGVSRFTPLYTFRYVLFCTPAAALLIGTGLAALGQAVAAAFRPAPDADPAAPARARNDVLIAFGWATGAAALLIFALFGLSQQGVYRSPTGHQDDIRGADRIVAANMLPGDAVIYDTPADENLRAAYPNGMAKLSDIAQYRTPIQSGTLSGTTLPTAVVRQRIANVSRLWVIEVHQHVRLPLLQGLSLRQLRYWHHGNLWMFLYVPR